MLAHGVSRGNVFKSNKLRSSERRQDLRKVFCRPSGAFSVFHIHPRLAPWANIYRCSAAIGSLVALPKIEGRPCH
jgi:hypothetical protein